MVEPSPLTSVNVSLDGTSTPCQTVGGGSLASSGGGIRTDLTRNLDLDLELAFPLTGPRYDTDDKSPRFNVAVTQSF